MHIASCDGDSASTRHQPLQFADALVQPVGQIGNFFRADGMLHRIVVPLAVDAKIYERLVTGFADSHRYDRVAAAMGEK